MDAKITLSFDGNVIEKAKKFADANDISLSRLTEFIYRKITTGNYQSLEELPISDWIAKVAEGKAEYHTKARTRKAMKQEFFKAKK